MYKSAREAFGWTDQPGQFGNFRPLGLARILTQAAERDLRAVRVYTGMPTPERDSRGHGAMQRRVQSWSAEDPQLVTTHVRPLRYPPSRGREKGVDVQLAVDLVRLALEDEYDAVVLGSADSDLVPALEFVSGRFPDKVLEAVAWEPLEGCQAAAPIDVPGGGILRTTIEKRDFDRVADRTNFLTSRQAQLPGQSGRRLPPHRR
jgi:NYN domain